MNYQGVIEHLTKLNMISLSEDSLDLQKNQNQRPTMLEIQLLLNHIGRQQVIYIRVKQIQTKK